MYTDVSTHIPRISLETTTDCVAIDPTKTALVVVDLQNCFLSPSIGRPASSAGMKVVDQPLKVAIPACRKAGMPILWLNWGLTEKDIDEMPPTIVRGFAADNNFDGPTQIKGLGSHIGRVQLEDGSVVDGGRVLMRDRWNSASYAPLEEKHQPQDTISGHKSKRKPSKARFYVFPTYHLQHHEASWSTTSTFGGDLT
jgi:nicotinamidase-related amidase